MSSELIRTLLKLVVCQYLFFINDCRSLGRSLGLFCNQFMYALANRIFLFRGIPFKYYLPPLLLTYQWQPRKSCIHIARDRFQQGKEMRDHPAYSLGLEQIGAIAQTAADHVLHL